MKKSTRGSIRKAPNAVSWVFSFINLQAWGHSDPGFLIRAWKLGNTWALTS